MTLWKSFGASVRGPGHVASGLPNQDAWMAFHTAWGDGIALADGLGSKPYSNFGSLAACLAVESAARACRHADGFDWSSLPARIYAAWLSLVAPLTPGDCATTCLFAIRPGDGFIHLGLLRDGLAAVVRTDGAIALWSEDKSQGFSNLTAALSGRASAQDWRQLAVPEGECAAVLLCTDGVADDLADTDGFVQGFIGAYRPLAAVSANRHARAMLENWPTPRHSDDKTIACLCREQPLDE